MTQSQTTSNARNTMEPADNMMAEMEALKEQMSEMEALKELVSKLERERKILLQEQKEGYRILRCTSFTKPVTSFILDSRSNKSRHGGPKAPQLAP